MTAHGSGSWSHDQADWRHFAHLTRGKTWDRVPFAASFARAIPEKPGVYIICGWTPLNRRDSDAGFRVPLYVGQTGSLCKRFSQHLKNPPALVARYQSAGHPDLRFWFLNVGEPWDRSELELAVWKTFACPANKCRPAIPARLGSPEQLY